MNFLNPLILYGLIAAGLPLLIHFISRRRVKDVPFPSVEFLERIKVTRMRRLKLKQIIILLLRTLIVALIVLAFARPALKSVFRGNSTTTAVIILDDSASMRYIFNGEMIFKKALRNAKDIAGTMSEKDDLALIVTGKSTRDGSSLIKLKKNTIDKELSGLEPSWTHRDVSDSFKKAAEYLREKKTGNKEVYYITDNASSSFPDSIGVDDKYARFYAVIVSPEDRENNALTAGNISGSFLSAGRSFPINVEGISDSGANSVSVELMVNDERKDLKTVPVNGQNINSSFTYTPDTSGLFSVCLSLDDNGFLPGEKYRFVMDIPSRKNILIVGEKESDFYYLRKALTGTVDNSLFNVTESRPFAVTEGKIDSTDVVILSNVSALQEKTAKELVNAVIQNGMGLIFLPPVNMENSISSNMILRDVFNAVYKSTLGDGGTLKTGVPIDFTDKTSPVAEKISQNGNYENPRVFNFHRFEYGENIRIGAKLADGSLAFGMTECGKGSAVLFSFNLNIENTDFPLTGVFSPLMIDLVSRVSGRDSSPSGFETGGDVKLYLKKASSGKPVIIKDPDGGSKNYETKFDDKGEYIFIESVDKPGFYSVLSGGEESQRFAVNIPLNEKIFEPADTKKIEKACGQIKYRLIYEKNDMAAMIGKERFGTEIFIPLLLLAGCLMIVEMAISKKA